MNQVADIYQAYDDEKSARLLLDFDDLLLETYRLLKENRDVREKYQGSFQFILVDEFQDTNPVQFEILRLLIREETQDDPSSFWVAGDDHQSIYSFIGASVGIILNFHEMFPTSQQFILDINYRSTPQILRCCQNLIRFNAKQIHKDLKTENPDGDDVIVLEASNEETEAMGVVNEIVDLVERRGYHYHEIAVLYRCNFQSRYCEEAFLQAKIPFHVQNGQSFYDRREVRCLLDYLRVINDPDSDEADEALLNILNVPVRYVSNSLKDQLKSFSKAKGVHYFQGLKSMIITLPYVRKAIKELVAFMVPLVDSAQFLAPAGIIQQIRSTFDYDRAIVDEDIPSPDDVKISNINQLQLASARYSTIGAFLEYTDSFQDEGIADDKEGVSLMTVHKAKGLEFPVVFVIGLVEGLMPSSKGNLEEERRICFVAISRAMRHLFLSYPLNYLGQPAKKSMFLDEILGKREPDTRKSAA
jgi:DNA helicase-2/ATP-dependent DNA helicase PcrA